MSNKPKNVLMDPEYWRAFMERAGQPIASGAPTWGSLVPGLGPYMATRNALNSYQQGDPAGAANAATEAALWLVPPSRFLNSAMYGRLAAKVRDVPLPVAPGLSGASTPEQEKQRAARMAKVRYDNPRLTEEYWQEQKRRQLAELLKRR